MCLDGICAMECCYVSIEGAKVGVSGWGVKENAHLSEPGA